MSFAKHDTQIMAMAGFVSLFRSFTHLLMFVPDYVSHLQTIRARFTCSPRKSASGGSWNPGVTTLQSWDLAACDVISILSRVLGHYHPAYGSLQSLALPSSGGIPRTCQRESIQALDVPCHCSWRRTRNGSSSARAVRRCGPNRYDYLLSARTSMLSLGYVQDQTSYHSVGPKLYSQYSE